MTTTVEAIYEGGKLVLSEPLTLPEKALVRVTIESDPGRDARLRLPEQSSSKSWDGGADGVSDALATMACDREIRRELHAIAAEFSATDGAGPGKS